MGSPAADDEVGSDRYEEGVKKKEVESIQKKEPLPFGQSESRYTKRWHQCSSYGYTRYGIRLIKSSDRYDTGQPTEYRHEPI